MTILKQFCQDLDGLDGDLGIMVLESNTYDTGIFNMKNVQLFSKAIDSQGKQIFVVLYFPSKIWKNLLYSKRIDNFFC